MAAAKLPKKERTQMDNRKSPLIACHDELRAWKDAYAERDRAHNALLDKVARLTEENQRQEAFIQTLVTALEKIAALYGEWIPLESEAGQAKFLNEQVGRAYEIARAALVKGEAK